MESGRTGKRILWVDDEVDLLRPHVLFLQARGYHVDAIANGVAYLQRAQSEDASAGVPTLV